MFLIPVVSGLLTGLLMKSRRNALITTTVLWVLVSGLLLGLAISEDDLSVGSGVVTLIGLLGLPLVVVGSRLRKGGPGSGVGRSGGVAVIALAIAGTLLAPMPPGRAAGGAPQLGVGQGGSDNSVYYVDWTSASAGDGTASGVINLPDGSAVDVEFTALFGDGSRGSMAFAQTDCGTNYWNPSSPYVSPQVPNAPPGCDLLALQGGQDQIYRLTLSEPIVDPLMAIVSLGQPGVSTTYDFDSPFTIVSQGPGYWGGTSSSLQQLSGDVLQGNEGHGTIRFLGTFDTFSWTVPTPEYWHGFTFGIRTSEALAQAVTVDEGQLATNAGTWSGDDVSLSASIGDVTKNADGTWDWSMFTKDGPAESQNVTITATNPSGSTSRSFGLVVENAAPTAALSNDGPVVAGTPLRVSFSNPADASSTDTAGGLRYGFACDGGSLDGVTYATASSQSFVDCTYPTPGEVTVRARIIDKDGGYTGYTTTATIKPADPAPGNVPGKVTGGGSLRNGSASFGLTAQYKAGTPGPKGEVSYSDKNANLHFKSDAITSLTISGTHATVRGTGKVNGVPVDFRVDVDDLGEPGRTDTFSISWSGYSNGGVIAGGNIQLHR